MRSILTLSKSPIASHPVQLKVWKDPARFKVFVAGRRTGKTFLTREMLLKASEKARSTNVYVAPTRHQAKAVMWSTLKDRVAELGWQVRINEAELKITRRNNAIIMLATAEKPDRLRGLGIDFIAFDEYADYRGDEIWYQVVRPALADKHGKAIFVGSPKGFSHFYDLFNRAKIEDNWSAFQYRTIDSPFFQTPEGLAELEEAKRNLSERDYRQEFEGSFENFAGRIYYAFDRAKCQSDHVYDPKLPILIGMDFNKSPGTCVLTQKVAGVLHQFDEVFLQASDTPEMCRTIFMKYPNHKSEIRVRPDATGSRSYSVNKNLSDHHLLREHGYRVDAGATNPSRVDRWASVNRALEKGWYKINIDKCPKTVKDLEVICYKEGSCEPMLKDPMLGHISDGLGYNVYKEFPILGKATQKAYA